MKKKKTADIGFFNKKSPVFFFLSLEKRANQIVHQVS